MKGLMLQQTVFYILHNFFPLLLCVCRICRRPLVMCRVRQCFHTCSTFHSQVYLPFHPICSPSRILCCRKQVFDCQPAPLVPGATSNTATPYLPRKMHITPLQAHHCSQIFLRSFRRRLKIHCPFVQLKVRPLDIFMYFHIPPDLQDFLICLYQIHTFREQGALEQ